MSAEARSSVALLLGVVTLRLALSNLMLNYVRPGMKPWLLASGAVLALLGTIGFLRSSLPRRVLADGDHGHQHPPSRAAWLLVLPVLAASLITPQALGSFAANRQATVRTASDTDWPPLPKPVNGAVELTLTEFTDRAISDKNFSLKGATVRLIGFATPAEAESKADFVLNRFAISCCAADAVVIQVEIHGAATPRTDSWVEVTGAWRDTTADDGSPFDMPVMDAKRLTPIRQPEVPYE